MVLQVSPAIRQALTEAGRIHIDHQRVVVKDQTPLIQCSRCLFRSRTEAVHRDHGLMQPLLRPIRINCPSRLAGGEPTCRNCQAAKLEKTDHNSFDELFPVRKRWDRLTRSGVLGRITSSCVRMLLVLFECVCYSGGRTV